MYNSTQEAIQAAVLASAKHKYTVDAVVTKTFLPRGKHSISFHYEDGLYKGYRGYHSSGDPFEVLAVVPNR